MCTISQTCRTLMYMSACSIAKAESFIINGGFVFMVSACPSPNSIFVLPISGVLPGISLGDLFLVNGSASFSVLLYVFRAQEIRVGSFKEANISCLHLPFLSVPPGRRINKEREVETLTYWLPVRRKRQQWDVNIEGEPNARASRVEDEKKINRVYFHHLAMSCGKALRKIFTTAWVYIRVARCYVFVFRVGLCWASAVSVFCFRWAHSSIYGRINVTRESWWYVTLL